MRKSWLLLLTILVINTFTSSPVYAVTPEYIDIPLLDDTYIEEKYPTIAPWNNRNLYLGTDIWYTKGKTRTLLSIDYTALQLANILPEDISAAELHATVYAYEGTDTIFTIDSYSTNSPWNMYSVTWEQQPAIITTKRDSTQITTANGEKFITLTKAVIDGYKNQRGILLKANPETTKALIFWAHGCEFAPTAPQCNPAENPYIRIFYTPNQLPAVCTFQTPEDNLFTNKSTVSLKPNVSIDPEQQSVSYEGKICTDALCTTTIWQGALSDTTSENVLLPEGEYYVSCKASDHHEGAAWGIQHKITVDLHAPAAPAIIPLQPVTGKNSISVLWLPPETDTEYQVLYSPRETFSAYNTYLPWTNELGTVINNLTEKAYYIKVKARDRAGNESTWSETTQTIIDLDAPAISYFKVSATLLSPKLNSAKELEGTAYIQAGATDITIQTIKLHIYDQSKHEVYTETVSDKSYIRTHWPDRLGYADGYYYAIIEGIDSLSRNIYSDAIIITIDTTPPKNPSISGVSNGQSYASHSYRIQTHCEDGSVGKVYIGGKIAGENAQTLTITANLEDGVHTLKAQCIDLALNSSETSLQFTVDTTPPAAPSFTVQYDSKVDEISAIYSCKDKETLQVYIRGTLGKEIVCNSTKEVQVTLQKSPIKDVIYTYTSRISDTTGNWSAHTEKSIIVPSLKDKSTQQVSCIFTYNLTTQMKVTGGCIWNTTQTIIVQKTEQMEKDTFLTTLAVQSQQKTVPVTIHFIGCKQKSFWDPRTWFMCVEENRGEITIQGSYIPMYSGTPEIQNSSASSLSCTHTRTMSSIHVTENAIVLMTAAYNGIPVTITEYSPKKTYDLALTYPTTPAATAFLSWMLPTGSGVSQWHGKTAYQNPHTGIDFSVYKAPITVPATGTIVSAAYNQKSACFAGGNYIAIKHSNGLYTYYFHLDSLKNSNGKTITTGTTVQQGAMLAITGNSGYFNCEPLAYHLHFEVRTAQDPATHLNPVPYINTDWSKIVTVGTKLNPGRLSGDNPHPNY